MTGVCDAHSREYHTDVWLSRAGSGSAGRAHARPARLNRGGPRAMVQRSFFGDGSRSRTGGDAVDVAEIQPLKARVQAEVDKLIPDLLAVSRFLHANPEIAYEERQAAELFTDILEQNGFSVVRGVAGLPTAFTGRAGERGPRIAFMAEYDALPGIGHACGHNLIGASSLGAALALRAMLEELDIQIVVAGCPAEEKGGGKIGLVEAGVFSD